MVYTKSNTFLNTSYKPKFLVMINNKNNRNDSKHKISRKEAIRKTGLAALTASTMMFLETKAYASTSMPTTPNNPNRNPRQNR